MRVVLMIVVAVLAGAGIGFSYLAGEPDPLQLTRAGTAYTVTVVLDRASTGPVDVRIDTADSVAAVSLSPAMTGMGHLNPEVVAQQEKPGQFTARGELFTMAGHWELAVRVRGPAGVEVITVDVPVRG